MRTWQLEMLAVVSILFTVNYLTDKLCSLEIIAAIAVILSFGHAQISDRLAEQESLKKVPSVACYKKMLYYFLGKEVLWFLYFFLNHSYSALIGVFVFLIYPFWRKLHRKSIKI